MRQTVEKAVSGLHCGKHLLEYTDIMPMAKFLLELCNDQCQVSCGGKMSFFSAISDSGLIARRYPITIMPFKGP